MTAAITNAQVTPWLPPNTWPKTRINAVREARRNVVLRVEDIRKLPSLGYFRSRKLVSGSHLVKVDATSSSRSTAWMARSGAASPMADHGSSVLARIRFDSGLQLRGSLGPNKAHANA